MVFFSANLLKSKFFIDPSNVSSQLTSGEISCTVLPDFPQAIYQNMRYIAAPGLIMTHDYPLKGNVTISVERTIEASFFNINSILRMALPIKQEEPISIHVTDVINLCGKELNCEQRYYSKNTNSQGKEIYSLKEYLIVYNCIGWALGIRDWINPSTQKCESKNDSLSCFVNLTHNYLNIISTTYNSIPGKKAFVQEDIISKLNKTVLCSRKIPDADLINKEGAIAFYFKNGVMTHAARFVHELEGQEIKSWVSKLGHDIMISHKLEDLAGNNSLYGESLCYSTPINQINCAVDAIGQCINEVQI